MINLQQWEFSLIIFGNCSFSFIYATIFWRCLISQFTILTYWLASTSLFSSLQTVAPKVLLSCILLNFQPYNWVLKHADSCTKCTVIWNIVQFKSYNEACGFILGSSHFIKHNFFLNFPSYAPDSNQVIIR